MAGLKLYKVTVDGCVYYWVAAQQSSDCARLIEETEGDGFEPETEVDIEEMSKQAAEATRIRCDDAPAGQEDESLWTIFQAMQRAEVIGRSEW